jgi:hypothetical protein
MAAFTYELTAKLGGAYASKTLKITLEDADGSIVNFEDAATFKIHDGSTCKIREKGTMGVYHIWCNQWPLGLPFTVLIKDNSDDSFIDSVDFNLDDFSRRAVADFDPATQADILSDATPFAGASIAAIKARTDLIDWDDITFLVNVGGGRWRIVDNQMIFYESDNETEVMRFDLKNLAGEAAMADVFERVRV